VKARPKGGGACHESLFAIYQSARGDDAADDCDSRLPVDCISTCFLCRHCRTVDFPTISVNASLPGGSAEIMRPRWQRRWNGSLAIFAGVMTEMTSSSNLGSTSITIQFDLSRNIDGAARDVQAAINAARTYLPANLPSNPTYRKVNPAGCADHDYRPYFG